MRHVDLTAFSADQKAALVAQMVKAHELGHHHLAEGDVARFRRLLDGVITVEQAYTEVFSELGLENPTDPARPSD